MTLKHVYKVKRNLYIYIVKNFFLYLMWDITIALLMQIQCLCCVSQDYEAKQIDTPLDLK